MRQVVDRFVVISLGWGINLVTGLGSALVLSRLLGPHGYAEFTLYGSLVGFAWIVGGLGVPTALTRLGASAIVNGEHGQWSDLRWAGFGLGVITAAVVSLAIMVLRSNAVTWFLGFTPSWLAVAFLGLATVSGVIAQIQNAILKTEGLITRLVRVHVVATLVIAAVTVGIVGALSLSGVIWAVAGGAVVNALTLTYAVRRYGQRLSAVTRRVGSQIRQLAAFGGPFTGGMLAGTGATYLIPVIILHALDKSAVAFFAVATTILGTYLGFLGAAVGLDYYPRIAGSTPGTATFSHAVMQQTRLLLTVATPVLVVTMGMAPILIPLVYTSKFEPVVVLLTWMLCGDLFRVGAMPLSYALLARARTSIYVIVDVSAGILGLGCTYLGIRVDGLVGLGLGTMATQVTYFLLTLGVSRYHLHVTFPRSMMLHWLSSLAVIALAMTVYSEVDALGERALLLVVLGLLAAGRSVRELRALRSDLQAA